MNRFFKAAAVAGLVTLAACGGQGDDALGENVQENLQNQADTLDAAADNAGVTEDAIEDQAEALGEKGEAAEEAIDDADVNAAATSPAEVNAIVENAH